MPGIDFTLPHWAYWVGLVVFPLVAMVLARRTRKLTRRYSVPLGYMILVTGGMLGLHRFYARNIWGLLFIPVFLLILVANNQGQQARSAVSDASNVVRMAERTLDREGSRVADAERDLPALREAIAETEEGSFARRSAEKKVTRAEERLEKGRVLIAEAEADLETAKPTEAVALQRLSRWNKVAKYAFWLLLAAMALDVFLLPMLIARANRRLDEEEATQQAANLEQSNTDDAAYLAADALNEEEARREDSDHVSSGWTGWIDRLALYAGEFVSYWAVIAVLVYYFEVISRYVFNSPTNWAHESMYLMFGMQYLIAGSYAMLTESHVRVDIFYANMSPRRKAIVDLLTSVFFFIFAGTLLMTSYIFAFDAIAVPSGNGLISQWARGEISGSELFASWNLSQWTDPNIRWGEISFNEWEVPLWPMKWVMVIGALLLLLQGVSKFAQDLRLVVKGG